jgi:hypothetical protein
MAKAEPSGKALVTQGHHRRHLFVERHIGLGVAPKVHHRHLVELERRQVGQHPLAQLLGTLRVVQAAAGVAPGAHLRNQHQVVGVRVKCLVDQLVGDAEPVVVRGV